MDAQFFCYGFIINGNAFCIFKRKLIVNGTWWVWTTYLKHNHKKKSEELSWLEIAYSMQSCTQGGLVCFTGTCAATRETRIKFQYRFWTATKDKIIHQIVKCLVQPLSQVEPFELYICMKMATRSS
jgi:hypothetical protein